MGAISIYIHETMQSSTEGDEVVVLTKEQDAARMMAGMELLTKVSSIQREFTESMMKAAEVNFRAEETTETADSPWFGTNQVIHNAAPIPGVL